MRDLKEKRSAGKYTADDQTIYLTIDGDKKAVAEGFGEITGISVSCDRAFLYTTDAMRREVLVMTILEDGSLADLNTLSCMIHLKAMATKLGAADICGDAVDNLYLATEWGIQITPAYGNLNVILPLPEDLPADEVNLEENHLYVRSGQRCFKRLINKQAKLPGDISEPEDTGERAMDFGAWTEAFQPELEKLNEDERNIYLKENTFFSTHPAYLRQR